MKDMCNFRSDFTKYSHQAGDSTIVKLFKQAQVVKAGQLNPTDAMPLDLDFEDQAENQ